MAETDTNPAETQPAVETKDQTQQTVDTTSTKPADTKPAKPDRPAAPTDVVLAWQGKKGETVGTIHGTLPPRDLTRADVAQLIQTRDWLDAVLDTGKYTPVAGTRIVLPKTAEDRP